MSSATARIRAIAAGLADEPSDSGRRIAARELEKIADELEAATPPEPRDVAVRYLQEKIRDGEAGFDSYDRETWIVASRAGAGKTAVEAIDELELVQETPAPGGGYQARYAVLDELRLIATLGLDPENLPTIATPLASRGI